MTDNSNDKPYRVAIWCAVSSKVQAADDKVSLEAQEQAGRDWVEEQEQTAGQRRRRPSPGG